MENASTGVAERDGAELATVRPRLRHDVVFAESEGGVLLRHSDNAFFLKGKSAYRVVASLSPHLNGEHTVEQLCGGLGSAQAHMVSTTIGVLLQRGFVRDRQQPDTAGELAPGVVDRFQRQLAFVEHYVDGTADRFAAFRDSRVLLTGTGAMVDAAVLGLLRNGLHRVHLTGTAGPEGLAEAAALTGAGAPAEVLVVAEPDPADFDVVVCGDSAGPDTLAALVRRTVRAGGPAVLPAVVVGGTAFVGPLSRGGSAPCWFCAMLRVGAVMPGDATAELWRSVTLGPPPAGQPIAGPAAALIGNALAFDVFRLRTGCLPAETDRAILTCDLDTLESRRGVLLRHPLCPVCPAPEAAPAEALEVADLDAPPLPPDEVSAGDPFRALVDERVGVLTRYTDGALNQSPVRVGRVRLPDPTGASRPGRDVVAFDLDTTLIARSRAVTTAVLRYVDTLGVHPGLVTGSRDQLAAAGHDPVDPAELQTWLGVPYAATRWVPATVLGETGRCHVPAGAAFPLAQPAGGIAFEPGPAGGGSGRTRAEAVLDGLLSALAHRSLRAAADGAPVSPLMVDDPDVEMLTRAAGLLGQPVRTLDLPTGGCGRVVLALTEPVDGQPPAWRVSAGRSVRDAAIAALRDLVGRLRLAADGVEADADPPPLADFDPRALRVRSDPPADTAPDDALDASHLFQRIRAAGLAALVVETTTPDARDAGVTTVRVLFRHLSR